MESLDSPASPTVHTPPLLSWSMAAGIPPTSQKVRYSIAPAAVLVTVGEILAARWRGTITPLTPAPPRPVGAAQHRAEIAWIGDAVAHQQKRPIVLQE